MVDRLHLMPSMFVERMEKRNNFFKTQKLPNETRMGLNPPQGGSTWLPTEFCIHSQNVAKASHDIFHLGKVLLSVSWKQAR